MPRCLYHGFSLQIFAKHKAFRRGHESSVRMHPNAKRRRFLSQRSSKAGQDLAPKKTMAKGKRKTKKTPKKPRPAQPSRNAAPKRQPQIAQASSSKPARQTTKPKRSRPQPPPRRVMTRGRNLFRLLSDEQVCLNEAFHRKRHESILSATSCWLQKLPSSF